MLLVDSPQVAQVYVHGTRIPHPHYSDAGVRYFDTTNRPLPAEPPPAHRPLSAVPTLPSAAEYNGPQSSTAAPLPPQPTNLVHVHSKVLEREREQRDREKDRERNSIPGILTYNVNEINRELLIKLFFV